MNKTSYLLLIFLLALSGCMQEASDEAPQLGIVNLSSITFEDMEHYAPNHRSTSLSAWQHILPEEAEITFTDKATGQEYHLTYNPYDLLSGATIVLPYGQYSYYTKVWGAEEAKYLPYKLSGEFELNRAALDITVKATTKFGLITLDATHVQEAYLDHGKALQLTENGKYYYLYVRKGSNRTLSVVENFSHQMLQQTITLKGFHHYHYKLDLEKEETGLQLIKLNLGEFHFDFSDVNIDGEGQTVTDAEGNVYPVVKIGDQYWLGENLRSATYCNGERIPQHPLPMKWEDNEDGAYVLTRQDAERQVTNFYYPTSVASSENNICPCNWHVSTDEDWKILERYLGIAESELESNSHLRGIAAELADKIMANDWLDYYPPYLTGITITNASRFSAYPTGGVDFDYESDYYFGVNTDDVSIWYSLDEASSANPMLSRAISPTGNGVYDGSGILRGRSGYGSHLPIRCVKD
ncbi:fibrobacter succinogenes major paralogous domain-containing protein [Echinicola vietnamensis]|uniref:Fibrobacter succinogenes major paralogous domain-containing protein n=1 Tax=Echinicola vietnamensis (strain DSM 17526 / LMG 23754 / KMM 6221) TaxID=926556 RepID=L0FUV9_ECHVK|nr:fibrobacter succinogenes major paralogous domain-containing protein [Echinicola vietnamensis]AGA77684.1 hypothetical protein (Fib_succ_major) [Echinicola vietnamensis DSM 17526]